jgi:hypothetical protein
MTQMPTQPQPLTIDILICPVCRKPRCFTITPLTQIMFCTCGYSSTITADSPNYLPKLLESLTDSLQSTLHQAAGTDASTIDTFSVSAYEEAADLLEQLKKVERTADSKVRIKNP